MMALSISLPSGACHAVAPWIEAVDPPRGARGTTIVVRGDAFCGDEPPPGGATCEALVSGAVNFGITFPAVRAQVQEWSDDAISVTVPEAAELGTTTVVVTVDGRSSNGREFEVTQ